MKSGTDAAHKTGDMNMDKTTMQLTVKIEIELHKRLKMHAVAHDVNIAQVVTEALETLLNSRGAK